MGKRKRRTKPVSLASLPRQVAKPVPRGDMGPDTPMQRQGKVIEDVTHIDDNGEVQKSPNGMKRARRLTVADTYHRRGHLTKRQAEAAQTLLNAWECNFKSPPPSNGDRVDTFPKADQHITIKIDRISRYHQVARMVSTHRAFVMHVARDDLHLSSMPGYRRNGAYMTRLRDGLDALADALGLGG